MSGLRWQKEHFSVALTFCQGGRNPWKERCPWNVPWQACGFRGGRCLWGWQKKGELGTADAESHRRNTMRWRCRSDMEETTQSETPWSHSWKWGTGMEQATIHLYVHNHTLRTCLTAPLTCNGKKALCTQVTEHMNAHWVNVYVCYYLEIGTIVLSSALLNYSSFTM